MSKSKKKAESIEQEVIPPVESTLDSAIEATLNGGTAHIHYTWDVKFTWAYRKNQEDGHLYPYYEIVTPKGAQLVTFMAALEQKSFDEFMQEYVNSAISQKMAQQTEEIILDPTDSQDIEFTPVTEM